MKKLIFSAILTTFFTVNVHSAFIFDSQAKSKVGLYLGGQVWQSETSGVLGAENTAINFNVKKEQQSNYFIAVVHPLPLFPNMRISNTTLNALGKINSMQAFNFGGEIFPVSANETGIDDHTGANMISTTDVDLDTKVNVNYIDYTLSYEVINHGIFSFDLGLAARYFNGDVTVSAKTTTVTHVDEAEHYGHVHSVTEEISTSTTEGKIKTDEVVAMLYVAANVSLLLKDLSIFSQSNISLEGKHTFHDYQIGLHHNLVNNQWADLNMTLGYQLVKMEFNNVNNLYTDLQFKGAFLGIIAYF